MKLFETIYILSAQKIDIDTIPRVEINQGRVDNIFSGVLGIAGAVAVVFIVLGGIKYSTSQGDPKSTAQGKEMIIYSLVGLVIIILSFGIIQLVTSTAFKGV